MLIVKKRGATVRRKQVHSVIDDKNLTKMILIFVTGLSIGIIMACIWFSFTKSCDLKANAAWQNTASSSNKLPKPKFDFYEELQMNKVAQSKDTATSYNLVVGTYPTLSVANKQRAELVLLGLKPDIIQSEQNHQIIYKVSIGPFAKIEMAYAKQKILEKNQFTGSQIIKYSK